MNQESSHSSSQDASDTEEKRHAARQSLRRMIRSELAGKHEHSNQHGQSVQIWMRDEKFIARARWQGTQIGVTLGQDALQAVHALRRILTQMEDGTFVPGSRARQQRFSTRPLPRLNLRDLVNLFLDDRRRLKGRQTARSYGDRLAHALDFAELPRSKKSWPLAASINREFAIEFKNYLFQRDVARNGKPGGHLKPMAPKMVRLCLETLRAALNWAARADCRKLPAGFANPFTLEILGPKSVKDPLRPNPIPIAMRIRMIQLMDLWQLCNLTPLFILPLRFEDLAGAVIAEFDFTAAAWHLGTRLEGNDFNKGRVSVQMPLPRELCEILQATVSGRSDGPMFRTRPDWSGKKPRRIRFESPEQFAALCAAELRKQTAGTEQDRKLVIRNLLKKCGGVTTEIIGREIRQLLDAVELGPSIRPYDLRSAVTTEMNRAGIAHLELRYLTAHTANDILNEYTVLDPVGEMQKHFHSIQPLLDAIRQRAQELGA